LRLLDKHIRMFQTNTIIPTQMDQQLQYLRDKFN